MKVHITNIHVMAKNSVAQIAQTLFSVEFDHLYP